MSAPVFRPTLLGSASNRIASWNGYNAEVQRVIDALMTALTSGDAALALALSVNGTIYPSLAAGLAATASGGLFVALNAGRIGIYRDDSGTATLLLGFDSAEIALAQLGYKLRASEPAHENYKVRLASGWWSPDPLVMVFAGQSNSEGNSAATDGDKTASPDVFAWNYASGTWGIAALGQPPFKVGTDIANNSAFHAAKRLAKRMGRPVALIGRPEGGTAIGRWIAGVGGDMWTRLEATITAALSASSSPLQGRTTVDAFLWQQGENEYDLGPLYSLSESRYPDLIRQTLGAGWADAHMKFVAGEMLHQAAGGTAYRPNREWRRIVASGAYPRVYLASATDMTTTGADTGQIVHFSGASLQKIGERMADIVAGDSLGITSAGAEWSTAAAGTRIWKERAYTRLATLLVGRGNTNAQTITVPVPVTGITVLFDVNGVVNEVVSGASAAVYTYTGTSDAEISVWLGSFAMRDQPPGLSMVASSSSTGALRSIALNPLADIATINISGHPNLSWQVDTALLPRSLTALSVNVCPNVDLARVDASQLPRGLTTLQFGGTTPVPLDVAADITAENTRRGGTITVTLGSIRYADRMDTFNSITDFTNAVAAGYTRPDGTPAQWYDPSGPRFRQVRARAASTGSAGLAPAGWDIMAI